MGRAARVLLWGNGPACWQCAPVLAMCAHAARTESGLVNKRTETKAWSVAGKAAQLPPSLPAAKWPYLPDSCPLQLASPAPPPTGCGRAHTPQDTGKGRADGEYDSEEDCEWRRGRGEAGRRGGVHGVGIELGWGRGHGQLAGSICGGGAGGFDGPRDCV